MHDGEISLIGLGGVGRGLAGNMTLHRLDLTVADLDPAPVARAVEQGARRILWETLRHTVRVMFVIAAAGFFGWLLVRPRVPDEVVASLAGLSDSPAVIMAVMVAVLLVLGMFPEGIAVIVLTVPLFAPVMSQIGVDPIQFGLIMIMCSMVGLLTPPVGMVLFAVSSVAGLSVGRLSRALWPHLAGLCLVLLAVIAVPAVSTGLPNALMGP